MIKYIAYVDCSNLVKEQFEVGRVIGKMIDVNRWTLLNCTQDTNFMSHRLTIGFPTRQEAVDACDAIDDLCIVGLDTYILEVSTELY